jgi:hypothetical protein
MGSTKIALLTELDVLVGVCKDPQQPQGIPRVMEIAKTSGLEILPPPDAMSPQQILFILPQPLCLRTPVVDPSAVWLFI